MTFEECVKSFKKAKDNDYTTMKSSRRWHNEKQREELLIRYNRLLNATWKYLAQKNQK